MCFFLKQFLLTVDPRHLSHIIFLMILVLPETIKAYPKPMLVNCLILIEEFLVLMRLSCYCSTPKKTIDFLKF